MSPQDVKIAHRPIGSDVKPFIIAEMSGNHDHSLEKALAIVEAVAQAGADALKLQTYTADTMTLDLESGEFFIEDPNNLWQGHSLYKLYEKAATPWEWHPPIFERCRELGLIAFSTPFDATAVDFLESLAVPAYKIASFEMTDLPLIRKVASTGKPMILSTGMASLAEMDEALRTAWQAGCRDVVLLKCTSIYPSPPDTIHLRTIPHLQTLFDVPVGLSDHTLGIGVALAGVAMGACVIEKHVTLNRADKGVDAVFSLEPAELAQLVREAPHAWQALGEASYVVSELEETSKIHRRSLYITEAMQQGDCLTPQNLRAIRPGKGLSPKYYDVLIGKRIRRDAPKGTPVQWDLLE